MQFRTPARLACAIGIAVMAGGAAALPPLKDVDYVREGLITAGMAIEIGDKCPELAVRLFRGYGFLSDLKSHARALGYSNAEIDAYVDDKAEKARLESIARARLADLGAVSGDSASYCAVGREQIAENTPLGRLIH